MFRTASLSLLVAALATPILAQKSLQGFSTAGERTESNHLVITMENGKFAGIAGAAFLSYVPAKWSPALNDEAKIDQLTKGHLFRLGMNNWATLDNYAPISFGNVTVPAGIWYLGIARDTEGSKWTLVFVDPAKAKAAGATPPMADSAPRTHEVPLTIEKVKETCEKMAVTLTKDEKDPVKGTLSIAFGNLKTSIAYELKIAPVAEAAGKK